MNTDQFKKAKTGAGFIAALDQSGGSTPKALKLYGIPEDAYSGDEQMFDLVHEMRARIITSPAFDGDRIMGAILFEMTMDREIEGRPSADYLWNVKNVVPFLKIDKGLADEKDGAQVMKPMPGLDALLDRAVENGIFGTKERSFIKLPGAGLDAVVEQQFAVAQQVLAKGLVPIIEPEVDIKSPRKAEAEDQLNEALRQRASRPGGHAQADTARHRQPLQAARRSPEGGAGGGAFGRLQPGRGVREARPQQRCHRELLAGADGRTHRPAERRRVQQDAGCRDRRDREGVGYLTRVRALCGR